MANTITQFLIGIGMNTENFDKGQKKVEDSVRGLSKLSASISVAGGASMVALANNADKVARNMNTSNLAAQRLGTTLKALQGFDIRLGQITRQDETGAGAARLGGLQEKLSSFQQQGEAGWVTDAARSGFNTEGWRELPDAMHLLQNIVGQINSASGTRQQSMMNAFNITPGEMQMFKGMKGDLQDAFTQVANLNGVSDSLIHNTADYNKAIGETDQKINVLTNTLADKMLPSLTKFVELLGKGADFIAPLIKGVDGDKVAVGAAIATGVGAVGTAKVAGKILPGAAGRLLGGAGGGLLSRVAPPVAGGIAADWFWDKYITPGSDKAWGTETTAGGNLKKNAPLGRLWDWGSNLHPFTPDERPTAAIGDDRNSLYNPASKNWNADYENHDYAQDNADTATSGYRSVADQFNQRFDELRGAPLQVNSNITHTTTLNLDGDVIGSHVENHLTREYAMAQAGIQSRNQ